MISVTSTCTECDQQFFWKSQPYIFGNYHAGNVLLSFAMLCTGSCIRKTLRVFEQMKICIFNETTYYHHQRHLLIPAIVKFWRSYQDKMFRSLEGKEVLLAGDGRHDSMGHSAKFGTYTIFCCTVGLILHLVLVQVCSPAGCIKSGQHDTIVGYDCRSDAWKWVPSPQFLLIVASKFEIRLFCACLFDHIGPDKNRVRTFSLVSLISYVTVTEIKTLKRFVLFAYSPFLKLISF